MIVRRSGWIGEPSSLQNTRSWSSERPAPGDPLLELADPMGPELGDRRPVQGDAPPPLRRLRLAHLEPIGDRHEGLDHVQGAAVEIDRPPREAADLAAPQAGRAEQEPRGEQPVVAHVVEEGAQLLRRPDLHLGLGRLRQPNSERDVVLDQLPAHRVVERPPDRRVDVADRLGRQPTLAPDAPALEQLGVEALQIVRARAPGGRSDRARARSSARPGSGDRRTSRTGPTPRRRAASGTPGTPPRSAGTARRGGRNDGRPSRARRPRWLPSSCGSPTASVARTAPWTDRGTRSRRRPSCPTSASRTTPTTTPGLRILSGLLAGGLDTDPVVCVTPTLTRGFAVGLPGFEPGTFGPPDQRANQAAPQPVAPRGAGPAMLPAALARIPAQNRWTTHSTPWTARQPR